ncbi:MAG: phytanoyl-CoA dioxygenase [Gloeotrichia echinulata IR180]
MLNMIKKKISTLYSDLSCIIARWKHKKHLPALEQGDRQILNALKHEGVCVTTLADLGLSSSAEMLKAAQSKLSQMEKAYNEELDQKLPQIYTITDLPELSKWATEKRLLNIIENYIGFPIKFHGVHLRKDFPSDNQFGTLLWHSDAEDRRIIKIFIPLQDVTKKHGPFEYIPKYLTSRFSLNYYRLFFKLLKSKYLGIDDVAVNKIIPKSAWKSCLGSLGTVILADTKNVFHHGTLRTEERATLFFCYTANPPERPELCTQYWDNTFPRLELNSSSERVKVTG